MGQITPAGWSGTSSGRMVIIGGLCLALLLPLMLVQGLVYERLGTRQQAEHRVTMSFGSSQVLGGPVLVIPYEPRLRGPDNTTQFGAVRYLHVLPRTLDIDGSVTFEQREVGLYEIPVYQAALTMTGDFAPLEIAELIPDDARVRWDRAGVLLPVSDPRGMRAIGAATLDKAQLRFRPATGQDLLLSGVLAPVFSDGEAPARQLQFHIELSVAGTRELGFVPVGAHTAVRLAGPWPDPSFVGNYLPRDYAITADGFEARWEVLELNRPYGQVLHATEPVVRQVCESMFGFSLFEAAGPYQQITRATKYGLLFVALTFVTFFLLEVRLAVRLHPLQYLQVGLAMCSFYLLLLSLSEHLGFGWAYLIAVAGLLVLVAGYAGAILGERRFGAWLGLGLGGLYGCLYALLRLEELSLLLGSLLVFGVIAVTMYLTRHIDWYAVGAKAIERPAPGGAP